MPAADDIFWYGCADRVARSGVGAGAGKTLGAVRHEGSGANEKGHTCSRNKTEFNKLKLTKRNNVSPDYKSWAYAELSLELPN